MTHPQTNCLCEPARACSCRHPTIKLLEEALEEVQLLLEQEKRTGINNPEIAKGRKTMHLIAAALRTLIGKHEDVEGDEYRLPKEVFVTAEGWDSFFECTSAYRDKRAKNVPSAPYHRADTIVNEITRRIEDG